MSLPLFKYPTRQTYLDVVRGIYDGYKPIYLFGFNRDIATSFETVWNDGGSIYTFPAAGLIMSLASSSAGDSMGVLLSGLDANWQEIEEVVTLDGTNAVLTTKEFYRVNSAQIISGNNVGNITVSNDGTTYAYIEATFGTHQAAIYSVPAGHSFYITRVDFTSGTIGSNKYCVARACLKVDSGPELHFFETTFVTSQLSYDLQVPFKIPEKCDFSIEAKSSAQTNEITVFISGVLIKDEV